jgi:hypothetical protein
MVSQPHRTSLAVWDVPATAVAGERFVVKVGAKSSADCDLRRRHVGVCDAAGAVVASVELGNAPWPGSSALYFSLLSMPGP